MNVGQALMRLHSLGYRFTLDGDLIRFKYEGGGKPDPQAASLFEVVKANKGEAITFLRCHCPGCGGALFWRNLYGVERCAHCHPPDWQLYERLYPQAQAVRH